MAGPQSRVWKPCSRPLFPRCSLLWAFSVSVSIFVYRDLGGLPSIPSYGSVPTP